MAEQKLIKLKINEREVQVPQGTLVIEATRRMGTEVPSFCYYPGLSLQAACRMCLVEVEKAPKLQTACTLVATEGMIVRTDTEQVRQARKYMLEFLLTNHPLDCPVCDKGGECELQDMVFRYGADSSRFVEEKIHRPEEKWSELVYYDAPRCILCFRCVRVCDEGMDVKALGVGMRGANSVIIPNRQDHLECEECGMCIDICPVGALTSGTYRYKTRPWEMAYVSTVCTHCSNGCKTTLSVRNHEILRSNNRDLSGINGDFLCVKGRFGFDFTKHVERIRQPLVRKGDRLYPVSWEEAALAAATKLKAAYDSGGKDAIGFIGSNRTSNEENYLLQKLARTTFGTNNIDHHRTADYTGLITALGERAGDSLLTMEQLYQSKAVLLVGNDPTTQNPLVGWQIRSGIRHFGTKLFVINANEIKLKRRATQFVKVAAGQEAVVLRWLAHEEGQLAPELVEQLVQLKAGLEAESDVAVVFGAEISGAAIATLVAFGSKLPGKTRYLVLGDYANSRGAADMGVLPDRLPGYAYVGSPHAHTSFEELWSCGPIPPKLGLTAPQMVEAAQAGKLKALYVMGANPLAHFGTLGLGRGKLDLLIVQEMFLTETAQVADIVFPATSAYEKDGTVTNTSGEIQMLRKGAEVMGPRSDFDLLRILSHQLEKLGLGKAFHYKNPAVVFEEIRKAVSGYNVQPAGLLTGGAEATRVEFARNGHVPYDVPVGLIRPAKDTLFTSGTLGRFCTMMESLPEAKA
ncbi:MAG: NADH dehydrogenase (quinone) subunit G [Acidobacteria bacterium]|nr:MAG: NADH dehydrogenase (quinone) subunit G [Acidobacteriota bacterium]PYT42817.1 MAG: NADH dehydrogenase (quinone) subunit G [Acidobacteriota bacterium]PYT54135.1 MAG: NADH dehydrogenase (quinone) subunit G [Acidobacteriota bacterium]